MNDNRNMRRGCGCMRMARGYWSNFPYYTGPCADVDGCYGRDRDDDRNCGCDHDEDRCERRHHRCRRHRRCRGMFTAFLPVAVSANGIVPLCVNNPCRESDYQVNSGLITLENEGTYLATYTVKVPEATALDTMITLNVDGASQSAAATQIVTAAGDATSSYTGQAIFEAGDGATVSLRTSEAINVTDPAAQPMFTLSLVQLDE